METLLRALAVYPVCRAQLEWLTEEARCRTCSRIYPIVDGIPVLLPDGAATWQDKQGPPDGDHTKDRQADFFDRQADAEFEITRPHGTPEMYRWLLEEKFRRSVAGLEPFLPGATALTVCGGSGMDAEFLARVGAHVICSDISLGAARRARERARRYSLPITPIVADVERLPFADATVDLVYVHDGLHHLERPSAGLAEMARVAKRAVSVSEPARALATAIAVQLGLAREYEEAGNRVARLTLEEVTGELVARGFRVVHAGRYAMYYRHRPGKVMQVLSRPGLLPASKAAWVLVNALIGRWGNKLAVTAVRLA